MRLHLELLEEELRAQGLPAARAPEEALRQFGGVDEMKMRYRDQRGLLIGPDGGGPLGLAGLVALVPAVALLACAAPIRRARRIEPSTALRVE